MSLKINNCPRCGKVFVKGIKDVCPACIKEIDQQFEKCAKYLRENKGTTITELSEATEVTIKQITKFIREGRISLAAAPNLGYPCEICGSLIREKTICEMCRQRLARDVKEAIQGDQHKEEDRRQGNPSNYQIRDRH